jgi:hypothetical protein
MVDKRIQTADQLHVMLREHWEGSFLFRGENDVSYSLRPKFGRAQAKYPTNSPETERELLREFKLRGVPHLPTVPSNDWDWLAIAQHFGLATRLLDWTENPLIGAYFATSLAVTKRDRVLYVLNLSGMDEVDPSASPFDLADTVVYRPSHIARRITAQGGVFTVHGQPNEPFRSAHLERWVIDANAAVDIHITLLSYGINESSVFADLDGLARHLNLTVLTGGSDPGVFQGD